MITTLTTPKVFKIMDYHDLLRGLVKTNEKDGSQCRELKYRLCERSEAIHTVKKQRKIIF
jgi:hypothetical protein